MLTWLESDCWSSFHPFFIFEAFTIHQKEMCLHWMRQTSSFTAPRVMEKSNHCLCSRPPSREDRDHHWLSLEHRVSFGFRDPGNYEICSRLCLCRHSTRNLCWRERGKDPSRLPQDICPSVPNHPSRDSPPCPSSSEVLQLGNDGGRQPRQRERPHMASLCWKIQPPQHGPEAATSCQGAYGRYRDNGEPVSQVRRRQVTSLEPTRGLPVSYRQSQQVAAPYTEPAGQSDGSLCRGAPSISYPPQLCGLMTLLLLPPPDLHGLLGAPGRQSLLPFMQAVEVLGPCYFPGGTFFFFSE